MADSLQPQPSLLSQGYQCQVVDYNNPTSIQHSLMGVDTVISTVTGNAQLRLIEAAVQCRVRRFAPAEFEGQPGMRAQGDPLDRGKAAAAALLQHYGGYIQATSFVCGILYERFSVNGMRSHRIGVNTGYGNEGDYILDARNMTAEAPVYDSARNLSYLCLTSTYDVGRFVVRALDMTQWPAEMSMCGERMTVNELIEAVRTCRGSYAPVRCVPNPRLTDNQGRLFNNVQWQDPEGLRYELTMAQMEGDVQKQRRLLTLIATAEGRYDYTTPAYLNSYCPDLSPISFRDWFTRNWASVP